MSERECGDCEVCCFALNVPDLNKPAGARCRFLNDTSRGCSLHNTSLQANVCRSWQCYWKKGLLHEAHRPDKIGFVAYMNGAGTTINITETKTGVIKENAEATEEVLKYSDYTGMNVTIKCVDGDKMMVVPKTSNDGLYDKLDNVIKAYKQRVSDKNKNFKPSICSFKKKKVDNSE